jgi:ribosomal protein S18 acetylase RimI-like enzyme
LRTEPEYSIVERNLRATMRFFGQASGSGDIQERDGVLLIDSGVDYAVFNMVLLTSPVATRAELEGRIAAAADYFRRRGARWSFWLCEDLLDGPVRCNFDPIFESRRLRRLTEAPGMLADRLAPPTRRLPAIESRKVRDRQTRCDFTQITSLNFEIPYSTCRLIYEQERAWDFDYKGYVGYLNGRAVATVAVVVAEGAAGVYSVSTLPAYRRRGYAEALMRDALSDCVRATGIERTILQATRAGYAMYQKMGYREVTRFSVYIT